MDKVIVGGSEGLIGKGVVRRLKKDGYIVIENDIKNKNNVKLDEYFNAYNIFKMYKNIIGIVNCAYPIGFNNHCDLFMSINNHYSYLFSTNNGGSIVNLASIYGILGPDYSIYRGTNVEETPDWYCAAKGAIIAHSRCLATRYARNNVRINCIAAGGVFDNQDPKFVEKYNNRVPMGRMATVEDIASTVAFLISKESKYITGECIPVCGGLNSW